MARNMYGATSADFTLTAGGRVIPGAVLTLWSARTGGTQITDLLDVDSVATTTVTSDASGAVVYYGPNNDKTVHWADSGQGSRVAIRPVDITGDPPVMSIGTVGTGTAAASLTGTSEAPVLNLTLPSAGTNGVNTAAIQDGAVTSAKIADGTIVATDVAASTFAAFGTVGNLLTANQASCGDTIGNLTGFAAGASTTLVLGETPRVGSYSLQVVRDATTGPGVFYLPTGTSGVPVTPGETYTVVFWVKALANTRTVTPYVYFYNAGGAGLGEWEGPSVVDSNSAWTLVQHTVVAPATAAYMSLTGFIASMGATEIHFVDCLGLWKGAGGQWALPGTPIVGLSEQATNGAVHLSGTGTPEGVVTAAPGSTWLQTDATTDVKGWIRWIKATGTGNTGWVAGAEADTGWRDVAALLINSWTANLIQMRRVGSRVEVKSGLLKGGATISTQMLAIPAGFTLSAGAVCGVLFREDGVSGNPGWLIAASATLNYYGGMLDGSSWTVNHGVSMETSWLTDDAWPSSLPGSAA